MHSSQRRNTKMEKTTNNDNQSKTTAILSLKRVGKNYANNNYNKNKTLYCRICNKNNHSTNDCRATFTTATITTKQRIANLSTTHTTISETKQTTTIAIITRTISTNKTIKKQKREIIGHKSLSV